MLMSTLELPILQKVPQWMLEHDYTKDFIPSSHFEVLLNGEGPSMENNENLNETSHANKEAVLPKVSHFSMRRGRFIF